MTDSTPKVHILDRLERRWLIPLILAVAGLTAARAIILMYRGVASLDDDAYYYLIPARNCQLLGYYTFDGHHATNGFHPLWMFLVRIVMAILGPGASDVAQTTGLVALEATLYLSAVALVCLAVKRLRQRGSDFWLFFLGVALVLVYPFTSGLFFRGMETTLATVFFVLLMWSVAEQRLWLFAIAAPLLFLSRLDSLLFLIVPCALYLFLQSRDVRKCLLAVTPLIVAVGIYLSINQSAFGHPMPISGMLKSSFPRIHFNPTHLLDAVVYTQQSGGAYYKLILFPANLTLLAALTVGGFALAFATKRCRGFTALCLWLPALLILNIVLFQKWDKQVESWYLVLPMVTGLSAFFYVVAGSNRRQYAWRGFALVSLAGSALFAAYGMVRLGSIKTATGDGDKPDVRCYDDAVLNWLGVPMDAVLAGTDVGYAGFVSHRRIVNLDGLINNFEYQDALRTGHLLGYLKANGVSYLIVTVWRTAPTWELRPNDKMYVSRINPQAVAGRNYHISYRIYSYLYDTYSEPIELGPELEVYRTPITKDGLTGARDLLFDIRRLP